MQTLIQAPLSLKKDMKLILPEVVGVGDEVVQKAVMTCPSSVMFEQFHLVLFSIGQPSNGILILP